ncbi:ISPsy14, transposase, partial [Pseudomonas syringae pv. tagetis]
MVMRQEHCACEKLFVDYAGQTAPIIDRQNGEIRQAQIFVAFLGTSSYTLADATWSQKLLDGLGSHVRCFTVSQRHITNPGARRSTQRCPNAHRYVPGINPYYGDLAVAADRK